MRRRVEWAVIERIFRGVSLIKGGLGSKEEAELWLAALEVTRNREAYDRFLMTDGITSPTEMYVAWRYIDGWRSAEEEPEE